MRLGPHAAVHGLCNKGQMKTWDAGESLCPCMPEDKFVTLGTYASKFFMQCVCRVTMGTYIFGWSPRNAHSVSGCANTACALCVAGLGACT